MKPTIEEVKKVAIECGMNDSVPLLYLAELQSFAQHYKEEGRKEQQATDGILWNNLVITITNMMAANKPTIRNNTGE